VTWRAVRAMQAESHRIRRDSALGRLIGALARTPASGLEEGAGHVAVSNPGRVYTYPPPMRREAPDQAGPGGSSSAIALISARTRASDLASVLGSVLGGLLDIEVAVYHLGRSRDIALDLAADLADAGADAAAIACTLIGELNAAVNITRSLGATRDPDLARELDRLVTRTGLLAAALVREIRQITVDACGVSLTDVAITDPEVLAGVLWNAATRWPASLADWIWGHSEQIGAGCYQVFGGSSRQDADPSLS